MLRNIVRAVAAAYTGGASEAYFQSEDRRRAERDAARAQSNANATNLRTSYDFAQNSIQWKVADAKKAGIHPLYALGSPGIQSSANIQAEPVQTSDSFGNLMRAITKQNPVQQAQLRKINAETDFIREQMEASKAARTSQNVNSQQDNLITALDIKNDNPKPRKKLHLRREKVKTVIGELLPNKKPGYIDSHRLPERYGDEAKDILGLINLWNDWWRKVGSKIHQRNVDFTNRFIKDIQKRGK